MRTLIVIAALVAASVFVGQPAECGWCPAGPCMTNAYCMDCVCIIDGSNPNGTGRCWGVTE